MQLDLHTCPANVPRHRRQLQTRHLSQGMTIHIRPHRHLLEQQREVKIAGQRRWLDFERQWLPLQQTRLLCISLVK
jgi:hypothetical protein